MSGSATSLTQEVEAVRQVYAALNRNDVPGFMAIFDPDVVRVEFEDSPQGGTYRGMDAVREHVEKGRGTWAEGGCEPQRFIVAGDVVIVLVHVRVRLKTETQWREGDVVDGFRFRNGRATEFRSFFDRAKAFAWAGISEREAS